MRVNPSHINAYAREVSLATARTGSVVDLKAAQTQAASAPSAPSPNREVGSIRGVLTPEESRLIAALFPQPEGRDEVKAGHTYTYAGRAAASGAKPGLRLDLKG